jgi:hypothetical protein
MLYMIYRREIQMRWAIQVVIMILLASFALAGEKISVADLLQNPERYDGKTVIVEGKIISYQERFSRRGNQYTTFRLEDNGFSVAVFAWGHLGFKDGLRVRVSGVFQKVKQVGRYTFYNEISADKVQLLK